MSALDWSLIPAFALASTVVVLAPGADVFLLLRTSVRHGSRSGGAALLGIHLGNVMQATLMVSGVGLVLSRSEVLMSALRWLGAAYLLYLAGSIVWSLVRSTPAVPGGPGPLDLDEPVPAARSYFARGLLTNVTNPKVILFFLAFFPQFTGDAGDTTLQLTLLSVVFIAIAFAWELALVLGAARVSRWVAAGRGLAILDAITAAAFVIIAAFLVVSG